MSSKVKISIVLLIVVLTSCISETERQLRGQFIIKTVEYRDSICEYGTSVFLVNVLRFKADYTCQLPILIEQQGLGTNGNWYVPDEGQVVIEGCEADFYNDTFEVKVIPNPRVREIHLRNDSIWFRLLENSPIF